MRLSEEVSRLSQHEVFALGEGECAEHKAGEQQHGDDVVASNAVRHRVASHAEASAEQVGVEVWLASEV